MKIGIFDSGIGGLSIVNQLINTYNTHIVYVADTANMPYGTKSVPEIIQLSERITQFLIAQDVECIIIACHTISAIAGPYLAAKYTTLRFVTMLEAVIPTALNVTTNNRIGLMATPATIANQLHKHALQYLNHQVTVIEQPCPTLAPTIEHQLDNKEALEQALLQYTAPLVTQKIDTLILGCTHYDVVQKEIQQQLGTNIKVVSSQDTITALLSTSAMMQQGPGAQLNCYVSDEHGAFADKLVHIVDLKIPASIKTLNL